MNDLFRVIRGWSPNTRLIEDLSIAFGINGIVSFKRHGADYHLSSRGHGVRQCSSTERMALWCTGAHLMIFMKIHSLRSVITALPRFLMSCRFIDAQDDRAGWPSLPLEAVYSRSSAARMIA